MSLGSYQAQTFPSSAEFDATDPDRLADIEHKHQRVSDFLKSNGFEGLLLQHPVNFAWFTSGAICPQLSANEPTAAVFVSPDARLVVSNNVDSGEMFDKQLAGLGFLLKERSWTEPRQVLLDDLCRGRKMASDSGFGQSADQSQRLASWRVPLRPVECARMKELGRVVAHAVEATARNVEPGQTESEIAGQLAHRLVKHSATPLRLRAVADGRARQYRHWTFGEALLRRWCTISAVATRWGLCCAATRTVCFGQPPENLAHLFQKGAMLHATGLFFSRAGVDLGTVWDKVRRIYEKTGLEDDWQHCDQADLIGYQVCETPLVPRSEYLLEPGMAMHWHPSAEAIQLGDTLLVTDEGGVILTPVDDQWPTLRVSVKGQPVAVADMLCREPGQPRSDSVLD